MLPRIEIKCMISVFVGDKRASKRHLAFIPNKLQVRQHCFSEINITVVDTKVLCDTFHTRNIHSLLRKHVKVNEE